jgi:hypothetical protein
MNNLTTEEKVYLIKYLFSKRKMYNSVYGGFCIKYETHKGTSENTSEKIRIHYLFKLTLLYCTLLYNVGNKSVKIILCYF